MLYTTVSGLAPAVTSNVTKPRLHVPGAKAETFNGGSLTGIPA